MKLSWSHKLFLKINSSLGKNTRRDVFMIFAAKFLVFILLGSAFAYGIIRGDSVWLARYIEWMFGSFILSELLSYSIALIVKRRRPKVEFPESRQLIHTMGTWKSFPSDHAIGSFCIAGAMLFVPQSPVTLIIVFYFAACLVSFSRVYVGVHYPRDIIGGAILAHGVLLLFPWVISYIIEPFIRLW